MPQGYLDGVVVPDLVGLPVRQVLVDALLRSFLLGTGDPDEPPIRVYWYEEYVVTAHDPIPGTVAPYGSRIIVYVEERGGGGESGDREPRVPKPPASAASLEASVPAEDIQ
jgi:hypothetical protein